MTKKQKAKQPTDEDEEVFDPAAVRRLQVFSSAPQAGLALFSSGTILLFKCMQAQTPLCSVPADPAKRLTVRLSFRCPQQA